MARIKVRRVHREEIPGLVIIRDACRAALGASTVLDLDMQVDPELGHGLHHDPEGLLVALAGDETVGFAFSYARGRQLVLAELWVLPQHRGRGAGSALMEKVLSHARRVGAKQVLSLAGDDPAAHGLLLGHGFNPDQPVYRMAFELDAAQRLAEGLEALGEVHESTKDLLARRGQADLDRLDSQIRGVLRPEDHEFWLKDLALEGALVSDGERIRGYAYSGGRQLGPGLGSTDDAALAGLGWALGASARRGRGPLEIRVPVGFRAAIDAGLDAGGRVVGRETLYLRGEGPGWKRLWLAASGIV